jgi:hypothetical protein
MRFACVAVLVLSAVAACASCPEPAPMTAAAAPARAVPAAPVVAGAPSQEAQSQPPAPAEPSAAAAAAASPTAALAEPPQAAAAAVEPPQVRVRTIGLHIGGGPNDDAARAPYRSAVEARFSELVQCHPLLEAAARDGSFGVDLKVPAAGGRPEVQQPRTALRGERFRACVLDVFRSIEFPRPEKGATMISYSVRFEPAAPGAQP